MRLLLCPIDFSPVSMNALTYAANIAKHINGHLIIAHIIKLSSTKLNHRSLNPVNDYQQEAYEDKLRRLALQLENEFDLTGKIDTICQYGYLPTSLNNLIKPEAIDFVVMGTKGATGFLEKMIGTNTSGFIENATCPVLVIPAGVSFTGFKNIAYASDFNSEEQTFLKQLFHFSEPFKEAFVSIINILIQKQSNIFCDNHVIREIALHFNNSNYAIAQIQDADVLAGLHGFVLDNQVDVLAISIHKRNFLASLFHKSISKRLMYQSSLPILTLPENPYQKPFLPLNKIKSEVLAPA